MNNNKKPIDYYDRIADALEIISGDSSHINDSYKNMDYYDRMADALETIVENGEIFGGSPIKGLNINQTTNIISLKDKNNEIIDNSSAALPTYGINFDSTTGGLTLVKNGTMLPQQTVTIPNYGSPIGVTNSADMTNENVIYLYEGVTDNNFINRHFYYWDGTTWADGGDYAAATVQTDKNLLTENHAADAKATGEAITELKDAIGLPELIIEGPTVSTYNNGDFELLQGQISSTGNNAWTAISSGANKHVYIPLPEGRPGGILHIQPRDSGNILFAAVTGYGSQADSEHEASDEAINDRLPKYSGPSGTPNWTTVISISYTSGAKDYRIPIEAKGLIVNVYGSSGVTAPKTMYITFPPVDGTLAEKVTTNTTNINNLDRQIITLGGDSSKYVRNNLDGLTVYTGNLGAGNVWNNLTSNNYKYVLVPAVSGMIFNIASNNEHSMRYAVLRDYVTPTTEDSNPILFSQDPNWNNVKSYEAGSGIKTGILPYDAKYIAIMVKYGTQGYDYTPSIFTLNAQISKKIKWAALGDSITSGYYSAFDGENGAGQSHVNPSLTWAYRVALLNNWDLTNMAIGGTGFLNKINSDPPPAADDYTSCGFYIARNTDFTPYDLVTISYGVNDWKGDMTLGTINDTVNPNENPSTVLGAMKATIEGIITSNPACKIIVTLPLNLRRGSNKDFGNKSNHYARGYIGDNLKKMPSLDAFADKMIEICNLYDIQYIDTTRNSILNIENMDVLLPDGIHPSIEAHRKLALELAKKITF